MRNLMFFLCAAAGWAAGTTVVFDPASPAAGPFPTDFLTVEDPGQKTGLRMNLPVPDCATQYTACQEAGLIEQLDGYSLRARATVRFSAPVNPATLRDGIFYIALDNVVAGEPGVHNPGDRIAIDQVVYDPASNTAYAKPAGVLDQHRRYALVVTAAVKDTAGDAVGPAAAFQTCLLGLTGYCAAVAQAVGGIPGVAGASIFTTMSATSWLERARAALDFVPPSVILPQPRNTFAVAGLASVAIHQQVSTRPSFVDFTLPLDPTLLAGLDRIAIGSFRSPNFLANDQTIPPYPSLPGLSIPSATTEVGFNALLPSGPKPAAGYPVVIFGHGFGDSRFGGPTAVAPTFGRAGFAVIAIDAVGHGYGTLSSVTFVDRNGAATTLPSLGRSIDLNGDGIIEANEGCALVTPVALGTRDCFRQTVVDLMQLARVIRQGLDLDGDGKPDLDPARIYYAGESLGAIYGAMFTALEPAVRAAALNVGGGTVADIARVSPAYRGLATDALRLHQPPLLNQGATYNEDYPLPQQPVRVLSVPGALPIQNLFDDVEWLGMSGDPVAFAPHLKTAPLPGRGARPVLVQFARADRTMPNPTSTLLVRAAGLERSTWLYRHDLARAKAPDLPLDPHPFLVLFVSLGAGGIRLPGLNGLAISLDAQQQVASFLAADGAAIADPNVFSKVLFGFNLFEVPVVLPVDLGY